MVHGIFWNKLFTGCFHEEQKNNPELFFFPNFLTIAIAGFFFIQRHKNWLGKEGWSLPPILRNKCWITMYPEKWMKSTTCNQLSITFSSIYNFIIFCDCATPYARHYNPRFVYFLPTFWSSFMYCDLWPYVWFKFKFRVFRKVTDAFTIINGLWAGVPIVITVKHIKTEVWAKFTTWPCMHTFPNLYSIPRNHRNKQSIANQSFVGSFYCFQQICE